MPSPLHSVVGPVALDPSTQPDTSKRKGQVVEMWTAILLIKVLRGGGIRFGDIGWFAGAIRS